jgi:flap endonuclease-1
MWRSFSIPALVCSHLQGMFYRTSRMIQAGIKPVYVFDGKAPKLKRDELDRRGTRRDEADDELKNAQETGDQETIARYSKRTVKVTKTHVDDSKKLLSLMGVPFVEVCSIITQSSSQIFCLCGWI